MALSIPEGYANVTYIFSTSGVINNITTSIGTTVPDGKTINDVAEDWGQFWVDGLRARTYGTTELFQVYAATATTSAIVARNAFGTKSGDAGDVWSCAVIQKRTALKGQAHRGRCFMPGLLNDDEITVGGDLLDATRVDIQDALGDFGAAIEATSYVAVLLHGEGTASADTPDTITSLTCGPIVGVQRRRRNVY